MMWAKEISEGAHVGATTHQGAPGGAGAPWCLVGTRCTPLWYYLQQKIINIPKKIVLNFQDVLRTFIFWSFFISREFRKKDKHGILFYLTKKNRKQKVDTESCVY